MKLISSFLFLFIINSTSILGAGFPASYYEITNTKEQKEVFFNLLYKLIVDENLQILQDRQMIQDTLSNNLFNINYNSKNFPKLLKLKKKYNVKSVFSLNEFLEKVDVIPPSLALAQAAVESGWGKSRFVKEANNIFGHWTYGEKGLIPKNRDKNAKHKIRIFDSLQKSIRAYMLNLNSNRAYVLFREKRLQLREVNLLPLGKELSATMKNYSGIGRKYLKILSTLINGQNLSRFDYQFFNKFNY
ncbi:mannosyl-glycoprotein endo-beta-N-acetylglucosamidase [Arcobacter sp. HD9-500m-PIT-SAG03]|nr:mannosyl-glycoprotein endo-beta-N-acetylglucosamidase [Arcobacter sp. HD9-500m-PIT-SAG03]